MRTRNTQAAQASGAPAPNALRHGDADSPTSRTAVTAAASSASCEGNPRTAAQGTDTDSLPANAPSRTAAPRLKSTLFWVACFATPIAVLCALLAWGGIYPFGPESFLTEDLKYQYIDFFTWYRQVLTGQANIFYSFAQGLGSNTWGLYSYYLASPFNLLILLFDEKHLTLAIVCIVALKLGCMQLSMTWYLRRRFALASAWAAVLGLCFAWSTWVATNLRNPLWLDALILLPLAAWCCHQLIRRGSWIPLALLTAANVICCWYMAYITCLFLCLFVLFELAVYLCEGSRVRARWIAGRAGRFAGAMALGMALAAWTFVPTVHAMAGGSSTQDIALYATYPKAIIQGMLPCLWAPDRIPQFYTGIVPLALALLFLGCRRIDGRLRVLTLLVAMFLAASSWLGPLQYIWCGFRVPNGFYSRTAFLFGFMEIWAAGYFLAAMHGRCGAKGSGRGMRGVECARAHNMGDGAPDPNAIPALASSGQNPRAAAAPEHLAADGAPAHAPVASAGRINGAGQVAGAPARDADADAPASATGHRRARGRWVRSSAVAAAVLTVTLIDLGLNAHTALNQLYVGYTQAQHASYRDEATVWVNTLEAHDRAAFWRADKTYTRTGAAFNEGIAHGFRQLSTYSSANNPAAVAFLNALGYSSPGEFSSVYAAPNLVMDSLLGVRYVSTWGTPAGYEATTLFTSANGATTSYNPHALSLGYTLASTETAATALDASNPFERQNAVAAALTGDETPLYTRIEAREGSGSAGNISWEVDVPAGHIGYTYVVRGKDAGSYRPVALTVDDAVTPLEGWRFANNVHELDHEPVADSEGAAHTVTVSCADGTSAMPEGTTCVFYALDYARFEQLVGTLKEHEFTPDVFRDGHVTGTYRASADRTKLVLSIPYDAGWSVTVDGKQAALEPVFDGGMSLLELSAGEHTIEMTYRPPGLVAGIAISLTALAGLCAPGAVRCATRRRTPRP